MVKRIDIKDHIVQTASALFYRNGYNSTGINEIIKESGIAKATLYNHFKSKEELCISYLKYMNENFLNKIRDYCYSNTKTKSRILLIFDFLEEFFNDKEFNGCWCIKTMAELPKNDRKVKIEIQKQKKQLIDFIDDLSKENFKGKASKYRDSKTRQIYLLYESAVSESHLHQKIWPIKEAKNICAQII